MKKSLGAACIMMLGVATAACAAADAVAPRESATGHGPSTYEFLGESLAGTTGIGVYVDRVELDLSLFGTAATRVRSLGGTIELREQLSTLASPAWEYRRVCNGPDLGCGDLTALMADDTRKPLVIESVTISKAADGTFTTTLAGHVFTGGGPEEAIDIVGGGRMTGSCREVVDGTVRELSITARPECAAILAGL